MKKVIMSLVVLVMLLFSACTTTPSGDSKDRYENATIVLERSGMFTMPEFAIQRITIDSKGLTYETFSYENESTRSVYTQFNSDEYQQLIKVLNESDFFNLEDEYYASTQVADIGLGIITVETLNNKKTILIDPYIQDSNPLAIVNIMEKIDELVANANSPFDRVQVLTYQGLQCEDEPWDVWYSEGNINFIKAPTTKELMLAYYSSKNVEIVNLDEFSAGVVCQACSVCPDSYYYVATIYLDDESVFLEDGWVK